MANLPPMVTATWSAVYGSFSRSLRSRAMARLSSGMPAPAVYLVKSPSMAAMAAFLMLRGVGKSGSPMEKKKTVLPCPASSLALALILSVSASDT